ncbi:YraN family protein [Acinetobacter rathckeae]|uniref:YraN family protein n=1 Tax=Acinetobacter rathckeae TaxID=2605272 RepID=UPI0018A306EC|nr:YraN family protein [Acinetobacter rathckeae]MBF7688635.1 YraN family protein [Acinetobacter rathckeae]MBF7695881.1 YraN family protein [Acinetobacter rathckeae]
MAHQNKLGQWAEAVACKQLQQAGFVVLYQNYFSRYGEIDLVAFKGDLILFIEVKARASTAYGTSVEAISERKQAKIIQTAEYFIMQHPQYSDYNFRFDAICIDLKHVIAKNTQPDFSKLAYDLTWIENAFTLS